MEQIAISVRLHNIKEAILIHHEECGAYGAESTYGKHAEDLRLAGKAINTAYPQVNVSLYYLLLNGTFKQVN